MTESAGELVSEPGRTDSDFLRDAAGGA